MAVTRVGLVLYGLGKSPSGLGRYATELAVALSNSRAVDELTLLCAGDPGPRLRNAGIRCIPLPGCARAPGLVSVGSIMLRLVQDKLLLDILHDPNGLAPFLLTRRSTRSLVTVHDAFPLVLPQHSTLLEKSIYRWWLPHLLERVNAVVTVSHHSKADLVRCFGLDQAKVHVVYPGVNECFRRTDSKSAVKAISKYGVAEPYILFVGSGRTRKNLITLLNAYSQLRRITAAPPLVVAGTMATSELIARVESLGMASSVRFLGYVPDDDLAALYTSAMFMIFPSLYEGFGLPPLEAMSCGAPVICSNGGSIPEVVSDAALTLDSLDSTNLGLAMRTLLESPEMRERLREKGLERAKAFTWERTASQLVRLYRALLEEPEMNSYEAVELGD